MAAAAPRADLRLILVTELAGTLEACGCSGDVPPGVDRLAAAVGDARGEARRAGVPSVLVLAGNLFFPRAPDRSQRQQDVWHRETLAAILGHLQPDLIAPGAVDRAYGELHLRQLGREAVASQWLGPRGAAGSPSALLEIGGLRLGALAIEPNQSMEPDVARLRGASLVLATVSTEQERVAALRCADIVLQHGPERLASPASVVGSSALVLDAGRSGEGMLVVDLWLGAPGARVWQLLSGPMAARPNARAAAVRFVRLDAQLAPDPRARASLAALFERVNSYNAQHPEEPGGVPDGIPYVGSDACAACHTAAYLWWRETPHGRAFQTLIERGRQLDRDCIGCHTTGYGRAAGASLADTEHMAGVGCESCHGPGSAHADNPQAPVGTSLQTPVPAAACRECHDAEHSPMFRDAVARPKLMAAAHGRTAKQR